MGFCPPNQHIICGIGLEMAYVAIELCNGSERCVLILGTKSSTFSLCVCVRLSHGSAVSLILFMTFMSRISRRQLRGAESPD